ncbi:MAG TPA: hypothetical protein VNK23_10210 [Candidatus Dormibacteraeota bacterium]|nr:hypothetical protein [Candidatus Dormibacteraeota bacterium]
MLHHAARFSGGIEEPVIRVQNGIAQVIEGVAVKPIRSSPGNDGNLAPGRAAEFGRKTRSGNTELFNRIERNQVVVPAGRRIGGCGAAAAYSQAPSPWACSHIRADAIHGKITGVRALAVHHELAWIRAAGRDRCHPWRQCDQTLKAATVEGHVFDHLSSDHGSDSGVLSVERLRLPTDHHCLLRGPDLQAEIEGDAVENVQDKIIPQILLKALCANGDLVMTGLERDEHVITRSIAPNRARNVCLDVCGSDRCTRNHRSGWI